MTFSDWSMRRPVAIEGALGADEAPPRWSLGPATLSKLLMLNYLN